MASSRYSNVTDRMSCFAVTTVTPPATVTTSVLVIETCLVRMLVATVLRVVVSVAVVVATVRTIDVLLFLVGVVVGKRRKAETHCTMQNNSSNIHERNNNDHHRRHHLHRHHRHHHHHHHGCVQVCRLKVLMLEGTTVYAATRVRPTRLVEHRTPALTSRSLSHLKPRVSFSTSSTTSRLSEMSCRKLYQATKQPSLFSSVLF